MNTMNKRFPLSYSSDNNPLALDPPMFPGWTTPVEGYHGGIPAGLVERGLLCIVDPWSSMSVGDTFKFYWKDTTTPVWSTEIAPEQMDQQLVFRIDAGYIVGGDVFPVFYTVQRVSATQPEESTQLNLLVKLDPPGGFDEDQGTPGHSGLLYSIPQDIIDNGVGDATAGVPITIKAYAFMRRNDRINVAWGSENVYHRVTEAQVDQEIIITIPREIIEQAGDSNGVAIAYQVVDECGNYPGGYWRWSAVTHILVDLNNNRLDAPLVLVNGFPAEEIDLDDPAGNAVSVRVTSNRTEHAIGDTLRLTWRGTSADGSPVVVGPLEQTVETIPFYYDFPIPHDDVAAIAQGRASVAYVRIRSGEADRPSKSAAVTVIGDVRRYLAPNIVEASGNTLDPALNFYTLSVPYYAGRNPDDQITIVCEGRTAGNVPTYYDVSVIVAGEAVGAPVLGNLPKAEVQRLDGGSLTVYYSVNGQPASEPLNLTVGVVAPSLPIPVVDEANADDVLNPDDVNPAIGANVIVPYTATVANDIVVLRWQGSSSSAPDDSRTLTSNTAGKPVSFTVPFRYVIENLKGLVDVSYFITRGGTSLGNSIVRRLSISSALELTTPSVKEAVDGMINPADVPPSGATAQISVDVGLKAGDSGVMHWVGLPGAGSIDVPFDVVASDEGKIKEVIVPLAVVNANENESIELYYTLQRQTGGEPIPSPSAIYDVRRKVGPGLLLVMGARRSRDWSYGGGFHYLKALNAVTLEPIEALWRYDDETTEVSGTAFEDTEPSKILQVRTADDQVRLNPANIFGNGAINSSTPGTVFGALVARRNKGDLFGWGAQHHGGFVPPNVAVFDDILVASRSAYAFAALRTNGQVVAWGAPLHGGVVTPPIGDYRGILKLVGNAHAFAVLRDTHEVKAWGVLADGGDVPDEIAVLTDIVDVFSSITAFAALRTDGSVVAWGQRGAGGFVPPEDIGRLRNITEVVGNSYAFAARCTDGKVVAWGDQNHGGKVSDEIKTLDDIRAVAHTSAAFAVLRDNNKVMAWGQGLHGGDVPQRIRDMYVDEVIGTFGAFAVLQTNGKVDAWGYASHGGDVPGNIRDLDDIKQLAATGGAFAALRANGRVVTWGHQIWGGNSNAVVDKLTDIRAIYANSQVFTALAADGRVITWGLAGAGGNSDTVQDQLRGQVTYLATPASRGAARKADKARSQAGALTT